jgi:hypothetical protein
MKNCPAHSSIRTILEVCCVKNTLPNGTTGGMRVTHLGKYRFRFNTLSGQARSSGEQRCFRSNSAIAGSGLLRKCAQ